MSEQLENSPKQRDYPFDLEQITNEEVSNFIGEKSNIFSSYMSNITHKIDENHNKIDINVTHTSSPVWWAILLAPIWLIYRKMYKYFILSFVAFFIVQTLFKSATSFILLYKIAYVALMVIFGKYIYSFFVYKRIFKIRKNIIDRSYLYIPTKEKYLEMLKKDGGTSIVLAVAVSLICILAILFSRR